jgi:anti-anti-sigma factor
VAGSTLRIDESRAGGVYVVALGGRIDSTNAEQLMARLKDLLAAGENAILVDLSGVIYLTHEAERNAARFVLCSVLGQVRELFEMGGLLEAFTIHNSREEALAKLA